MTATAPCEHKETVTTDMSEHGVLAEVTACAACGHMIDYRPLRQIDASGPGNDLPAAEAEIQALAKIAKAKEIGLDEEIREESGITKALPEHPPAPEAPESPSGGAPAKGGARLRLATGAVLCQKHGGELEPCSEGLSKAHHCCHSKWGDLYTFNGPCPCTGCHVA